MNNYLFPRVDNIIEVLRNDFKLIASRKKDDEWKRDHYRYTFTISAQRMFDLLNSQLTADAVSSLSSSTRKELIRLRDQINSMLHD